MMVIRGVEPNNPTTDTAARTFVNVDGGRVWRPNPAAMTAFANRRYTGFATGASITTFEARDSSGNEISGGFDTATRGAALNYLHFNDNNEIILDASFAPINSFNTGDEIIFAGNSLVYVASQVQYTIYPADRCTWHQTYDRDANQYEIYGAVFYTGSGTLNISEAQLGYIGKSGRFVEIAG